MGSAAGRLHLPQGPGNRLQRPGRRGQAAAVAVRPKWARSRLCRRLAWKRNTTITAGTPLSRTRPVVLSRDRRLRAEPRPPPPCPASGAARRAKHTEPVQAYRSKGRKGALPPPSSEPAWLGGGGSSGGGEVEEGRGGRRWGGSRVHLPGRPREGRGLVLTPTQCPLVCFRFPALYFDEITIVLLVSE